MKVLLICLLLFVSNCKDLDQQIDQTFASYDLNGDEMLTKKQMYDGMLKDMGKFEPTESTIKEVRKAVKEMYQSDSEGDGFTLNELRRVLGGNYQEQIL